MASATENLPLPLIRAALCRISGVIAADLWGKDSAIADLWRTAERQHLTRHRKSVAYGIVSGALVHMMQEDSDAHQVAMMAMDALRAYRIADVLTAEELRQMLEVNIAGCHCRVADRVLGLGEECAECQAREVIARALAPNAPTK